MSTRSRIQKTNLWQCTAGVPTVGNKPLVALIWAMLVMTPLGGCVMDQGDERDSVSGSLERGVDGDSVVFTQAVKIADPYRARLPDNSSTHNFGRAIWDLHNFDGRIFMGAGNYYSNSGRTDVWTYRVDNGQPILEVEFTVDDEAVLMFHEYDGQLLVPGIDSTESWELGNFYTRTISGWTKHRTVPNGVHVYDIARYGGNLYVNMCDGRKCKTLESTDGGQTWASMFNRTGRMIGLDSNLVIMKPGRRGTVYLYNGNRLTKMAGPAFPNSPRDWNVPARMTPFQGGVLYTSGQPMFPGLPSGLYFLNDFDNGPMTVLDFGTGIEQAIQDVLVRGDTVHVLAVANERTASGEYRGLILASEDLTNWRPEADFVVPAPPYSIEMLDGTFYVGLGTEGWFTDNDDAGSGSIWRIE